MPTNMLTELEPFVAKALNDHLNTVTDWDPVTSYVPWGEGMDFQEVPWDPAHSKLSPPVQAALAVNLATEDELPGYFAELNRRFGNHEAWGAWLGRWKAEEGRHAIALRSFLAATRGLDPRQMESDRMATMQSGYQAGDKSLLESIVYVTAQELATRVSHLNTGKAAQQADQIAWLLLKRISQDENHHYLFYRSLVTAALDIAPSETVEAVCREFMQFAMPGADIIPGFRERAFIIAQAGIYNQSVHYGSVIAPLLRHWKIFSLEGLTPRAEQKREELAAHLESLRLRGRREPETLARIAARRTTSAPTGSDRAGAAAC
ncbi:acyl-ACP desaturase [Streptomyces montanus]|uniref:Acyl-ACP desaturase n=1 Tax=Streptomyces montanus TaxID=2580423 RepID=A0A5R9FXV2_9ACTN|nr:acyl-ACP desaturase [Streptomyces montanus]TLS46128.1 acyl-ACP desaturase [Streptomyces montanus]